MMEGKREREVQGDGEVTEEWKPPDIDKPLEGKLKKKRWNVGLKEERKDEKT